MPPSRWESPLKKGNVVICDDGLIVEILGDPEWDGVRPRYSVPVLILDGARFGWLTNTEEYFDHRSEDRFGESRFSRILQSRKDLVLPKSLEEEFFSRPESS